MQDGHDGLRADVSDDSAHSITARSPRVLSDVGVLFDELASRSTQPSMFRLPAARDAERAGGHVLGDRRSGRRRRRPCRRVTGAISCESLPMKAPSSITVCVLVLAVVVAGDGARADVDLGADRRVAEIRQVVGLRARRRASSSSARRSCRSWRLRRQRSRGRRCANGPIDAPSCNACTSDEEKLLMVTRSPISVVGDRDVRVDLARGADARRPSMITPGWITVSAPISTSGSM